MVVIVVAIRATTELPPQEHISDVVLLQRLTKWVTVEVWAISREGLGSNIGHNLDSVGVEEL
jgi:hypothetical protein